MATSRRRSGVIERDHELGLLRALLADAVDGRGGAAVVTGPVATGKTELLTAFAGHAVEAGAVVLGSVSSRGERGIPFAALGQALQRPSAMSSRFPEVLRLLDEAGWPAGARAAREPLPQVGPLISRTLWRAVLEVTAGRPLVLIADDADLADEHSLRCLSFVARRARGARVAVVLAAQTGTRRANPFLLGEVHRQPLWRQVRLAPLSAGAVAEAVARRFGAAAGSAAGWHAVSGGNPLLLKALLEDGVARDGGGPAPGEAFAEAVGAVLHRCDPELADVAVACAVLDRPAEPEQVADLLGVPPESVLVRTRALDSAGVTVGGRLPHAAARAAVLAPLPAGERAALRLRAARRLYYGGAAPDAVADLLLAGGDALPGWSASLLLEAGTAALRDDRVERAVAYLELGARVATGARERVAVLSLLVSAHLRGGGAGCARHVDRLLEAAAEGGFPGPLAPVVCHLVRAGRLDDAATLLGRLAPPGGRVPLRLRVELPFLRTWLAYHAPGLPARGPELLDDDDAEYLLREAGMSPQAQAVRVLEIALAGGDPEEAVEHAEHVLHGCALTDRNAEVLFSVLTALVDLDRWREALPWCEALLAEAGARDAGAWTAVLLGVRADIALRASEYGAAIEHARRALAGVRAESWGAMAGRPLATLLHAGTASGRCGVELPRRQVPEVTFRTTAGLRYWLAKGWQDLAAGRLHAAATAFRACGELAVAWGVDAVGLLPWRTGVAQVLLRRGKTGQARAVLEEQLARAHRGDGRVRGVTLRLLAQTVGPAERPGLLREAVEVLERCGAVVEQAHALADLGQALHRLGDFDRGRVAVRRAWSLAERFGVGLPGERPGQGGRDAREGGREGGREGLVERRAVEVRRLSEAERRVAELAARGDKNQEIARKLFITVSTVEQHLTRVYRKLRVTRRTDLPGVLDLLEVDGALSGVVSG
ncbi:transcriptional regulator, LuxR family [Actinosynnema mirum DSM 43827]|uniref:Transcriptional regulator, LuxR family n=1 Tax=Actinosynnema mirum (strain ATCC 29888 / DSM 43827 / JCM 3225 / NBRC 14064 / NCIMB 13271 / NRRL B-12336 / IMRU 3971 / 101) TaxID=446462 RepID=C6WNY2_ACTMD|nr:transcriptional regulator, LuxR family [Actinosynnema mirum DSM 43827]